MNDATFLTVSDVVAHVKSRFNFSVDKFRLSGPENLRTPFYGLFRSDNMECVGDSVRAGYEPHQTEDVVAVVEAAGRVFNGVADVRCHFNNGHHLIIQPTRESRLNVYGTKDSVFPRVMVSARYDGKAFKATLGFYRDACKNLSRIRSVSSSSVSITHTSGLRSKMESLIATFEHLDSTWESITTTIRLMEATTVNLASFLDAIYDAPSDSSRSATLHKNRTEAIIRRVVSERIKTGRPDLGSDLMVSGWEAYNAVQGYVQHEKSRRGDIGMFDRVLMADTDPSVAMAEAHVMSLAS
jgi:hypothetical protein